MTTMSRHTPWDEIGKPSTNYTVRRVAGSGAIPVFWGKDVNDQCLLIVELNGDHGVQFRKDCATVHGIGVDLRNGEQTQQQRLVLTLEKQVDRDLFVGLCETLVVSLAPVSDSSVALSVTLTHIKRWKAFLAGRKSRLLSPEEVRGLVAELHCLRALYQLQLTQLEAVDAWCGPEYLHQDFIFGNTAVEVKSLSGRERNTVRISSEDQLEGLSENLFLVVYRFSDMSDSELALSLNDIIRVVEHELGDAKALEQFSKKLAGCGYLPLSDYDLPRFIVSSMQSYRVEGEFPRLIRSLLPEGITKVAYDIKLEAIKPFECAQEQIFGSL